MGTVPFDHVGPWTDRVPQCSRDELYNTVVTLAQMYGFQLTGPEQTRMENYRKQLYAAPLMGDGRIRTPAEAGDLENFARRALDWLNDHAPDGKRFWLTDGLYLLPVDQGREAAGVAAWPVWWVSDRATQAREAGWWDGRSERTVPSRTSVGE